MFLGAPSAYIITYVVGRGSTPLSARSTYLIACLIFLVQLLLLLPLLLLLQMLQPLSTFNSWCFAAPASPASLATPASFAASALAMSSTPAALRRVAPAILCSCWIYIQKYACTCVYIRPQIRMYTHLYVCARTQTETAQVRLSSPPVSSPCASIRKRQATAHPSTASARV